MPQIYVQYITRKCYMYVLVLTLYLFKCITKHQKMLSSYDD